MTAPSTATGQVIAFRNDRLGGRLMMLVNALRLGAALDVPVRVHWHQGTDLSAILNDPTEFFDAGFVAQHFIDRPAYMSLRETAVRPQERRDLDLAGFRALIDQGTNILVDEAFGFPAYTGEDPADVARAGAALWRTIPLAPAVAAQLGRIKQAIGPDTTAYHIRRGDILTLPRAMNRPWPNKYVYDELYQTHMEEALASGSRPILFSDDAATIARFKARYPALIPAATLFDPGTVTPGQADFLELLALASCTRIVAPPQSAFSSGAATLGQVPIADVEQALRPEQRQAAAERLHARLRAPATPDMTPGDIGQSLVHLDRYLTAQNRLPDLIETLGQHLRAGLEISFLFPRLIEACLLTGDIQGAIAAGALMETRQVHHRPDYAKGQILHALAHPPGAAQARLANIALWHDPTSPWVSEGIGALYATGALDDRNALPLSAAARAMWQRPVLRLPACAIIARLTEPCAKDSLGRALVPSIDALGWDWGALLRPQPRGSVARHRQRATHERCLARLQTTLPGPDSASLLAVYDLHVGEKDDALARLTALAADHPGDAMVQHRLSVGATLARDYKTAGDAAERAAEIAPDVPAHTLWRSATRLRQKRYRQAMGDIRTGLDAGLVFPGLYLRLATAAAEAGHPKVERQALDDGLRAAPRDMALRLARAQLAYDSGELSGALADLALLMTHDMVPAPVTTLRQTCLDELAEFERFEAQPGQTPEG
jgi:tetratricopeptide (TPR) repeat protein